MSSYKGTKTLDEGLVLLCTSL